MRTMLALGFAAILAGATAASAQSAGDGALELRTLSTRPEVVSGGEVLVQISAPRGVALDRVAVTLNGRDARPAFKAGAQAQTLVGLLSGLTVGSNQVEASAPGARRAQLTVINHPGTGPVIAGPHQTPFVCETEAFGLGPALDANCTVKTRVEYFYRVHYILMMSRAADRRPLTENHSRRIRSPVRGPRVRPLQQTYP